MNYLEFLKYIIKHCHGCICQTIALNQTEMSSWLFYSFSVPSLFENTSPVHSSRKYGSWPLFKRRDMHFLWACKNYFVIFSGEMAVKTSRNTWGSVTLPGFQSRKETRLWAKAYLCVSEILHLAFIFHIWAVFTS